MKLEYFNIAFLAIMMALFSNKATAKRLGENANEVADAVIKLQEGQHEDVQGIDKKVDTPLRRDLQDQPCGNVDIGITDPIGLGVDVGCSTPLFDFGVGADATLKCFASHVTADVEDKGKVQMKDLKVGDKVLTSSGEYKILYSMNHHHATQPAEFLQIHHSSLMKDEEEPLEMTRNHMIFLQGNDNPIPAFKLKVGDNIKTMNGSSTVTMIDTVIRNGFFNPLTLDGTIIVNGVVASSYAAFLSDNEWVGNMFGLKFMPHQTFYDKILKPYRYMCTGISLKLCETSHEMVMYSQVGLEIFNHWKMQDTAVQKVSLLLIILFALVLDIVISPYGIASIGALIAFGLIMSKEVQGAKRKEHLCISD